MEYKISEQLLSNIVQVLNEIPAKHSRLILNRIDGEIAPQLKASQSLEKKPEKKDEE